MGLSKRIAIDINPELQAAIVATQEAIARLTALQIPVEGLSIEFGKRPTILVKSGPACRKMVNDGQAVRYSTGIDNNGRYQKYQCHLNNCRVVWEERSH
ncbi:hypothetical protein [Dickeya oryzae]|uniref:Uncharacterized protein n=1 Tax=Dickeya undicola TaxID=1577887 RepID=A0A3N0FMN2_9GAMM|nr:hypothetical protein [Dickeya oryzae]MBP2844438.1 hypothetical protein [Dickeya oryzae]MBP2848729.1 hypothetical protein [Dickeya oryzae]RNM01395.1 hypothetical protein EF878_20760 [Dickeya undicola]